MENENMQNQNNNPVQENSNMFNYNNQKSGTGSIVATIIIIAVLILGGLYFWGQRIQTERENRKAVSGTITEEGAINEASQIQQVSNDDSLTSIEADLQQTDTTNINTDITVQ